MSNKTRETRVRYIQSLMQPAPIRVDRPNILSGTPAIPGKRVRAKPLTERQVGTRRGFSTFGP